MTAQMKGSDRRRRRAAVLRRDGDRCWICGYVMALDDRTIDHVIPRSEGGPNALTNLKLAHGECNLRRAGRARALNVSVVS